MRVNLHIDQVVAKCLYEELLPMTGKQRGEALRLYASLWLEMKQQQVLPRAVEPTSAQQLDGIPDDDIAKCFGGE